MDGIGKERFERTLEEVFEMSWEELNILSTYVYSQKRLREGDKEFNSLYEE